MSLYSCYSDESGDYIKDPENEFLDDHPRFYRVNYMIKENDYPYVRRACENYKTIFGLPLDKEFKYTFLYPIKKYQDGDWDKPKTDGIEPFVDIKYENLLQFVESCLDVLDEVNFEVIIIVTENKKLTTCTPERLYEMHMEDLLPRVCQSISSASGQLGTFYFDKDENIEGVLSDAYYNVIKTNHFDLPYEKLKECLNFEDSKHSIGIQLADYVTGCCAGFIKSVFKKGYGEESRRMFIEYIFPNLRCKGVNISGYGIKGVPNNRSIEKKIVSAINKETGGEYVEFLDTTLDYQ